MSHANRVVHIADVQYGLLQKLAAWPASHSISIVCQLILREWKLGQDRLSLTWYRSAAVTGQISVQIAIYLDVYG